MSRLVKLAVLIATIVLLWKLLDAEDPGTIEYQPTE